MKPAVSIIVPVYNAQQSIRRCVDSILNQEFVDFEAILVDDGSTDESGSICDEYAQRDSRIRVIHKPNTGVSDSRNIAIKAARGEYLQFMDSDDWITTDATSLFYKAAKEHGCDMVIADFYRVVGQRVSQKGDIDADEVMTREEFASHMMENPADFYYGVLWNKFFKKEIVEKYQLRMDKNISWCEDFMFNLEYIRHTESIYALGVPVYYYVKTKGSLASQGMNITKTIQMKRMVFSYYHKFYKAVFTEEDYEKNRLQVYRFLLDAAGDGMVPPAILSSSKRLGNERKSACAIDVDGDGVLMDEYRDRKLLDRYLEQVALKYELTLLETRLLMYLSQLEDVESYKELADFSNIQRGSLSIILKRLAAWGYVRVEDVRVPITENSIEAEEEEKKKRKKTIRKHRITLLEKAEPVMKSLLTAKNDYEAARYAGFTEEELVQYEYLSNKIKENTKRVLAKTLE